MLDTQHNIEAENNSNDSFAQTAWASAKAENRLDSEMTSWLRIDVGEVFRKSSDWKELRNRLRNRGLYLESSGKRLHLCDCYSNLRICSCKFLGHPSVELEKRMGSPFNFDRSPSFGAMA